MPKFQDLQDIQQSFHESTKTTVFCEKSIHRRGVMLSDGTFTWVLTHLIQKSGSPQTLSLARFDLNLKNVTKGCYLWSHSQAHMRRFGFQACGLNSICLFANWEVSCGIERHNPLKRKQQFVRISLYSHHILFCRYPTNFLRRMSNQQKQGRTWWTHFKLIWFHFSSFGITG
jgi:hypothetical protein